MQFHLVATNGTNNEGKKSPKKTGYSSIDDGKENSENDSGGEKSPFGQVCFALLTASCEARDKRGPQRQQSVSQVRRLFGVVSDCIANI